MADPFGTVHIDGLRELRSALRKLDGKVDPKSLNEIHFRLAQPVVQEASRQVPVRTGRLQNTIRAAKLARRAEIRAGGARAKYAPVIHWGWPKRGIKANPFLQRSTDKLRDRTLVNYRREIDRLIASAFVLTRKA